MTHGPELLLVGAVAAVGLLHTIVPDHWVPIALIARQRGWSRGETARAALQAGSGHVLSTLAIALAVWAAGVAVAQRFGHLVNAASGVALIGFGGWVAVSAWRELRSGSGHGHGHGGAVPQRHEHRPGHGRGAIDGRDHDHDHGHHDHGHHDHGHHDHGRHDHGHHDYGRRPLHAGPSVPEHRTAAADDRLYAPLRGDSAALTRHIHLHRHGGGAAHLHSHDHLPATDHPVLAGFAHAPPLHVHRHRTTARTALLLILGSSPMLEGIPLFFAAGKYGARLIAPMAAVFALTTIATYVVLCVHATAGLQRLRLGAVERYGEVLSGAAIALVGVIFGLWPTL